MRTKNINFGEALERLKEGSAIKRKFWVEKYLYMSLASIHKYGFGQLSEELTSINTIICRTNNNFIFWLPTFEELVANDWIDLKNYS